MFASLSIYGLWSYNNEIFDSLTVPEGMDKDVLITQILTECSDFALIYPNYEFMKMLIGVWSTKEQKIWSDLYKSENFDYNPIENYDRYESISRAVQSQSKGETRGNSQNSSMDDGTQTSSRAAYDTTNLRDVGKTTSAGRATAQSANKESAESSSAGTETVTNHMHGNIGVTTAQQMIQGFRDISQFCTYDYIVQSFKDRFCIQVY